uniref:GRAM domain containing 4 n=1 Tax=Panthera tigris altaica TaxID=74533 RepID=A0A8C9KED7_PANTA
MLRRLDKIRFRGHKRDDFLDLAESPNASDTECGDEVPLRIPRTSPRDSEELRDPAGPGTLIMAAGVQDFNRTEFDRLNEIKGHLEIALLEKHFLREYRWGDGRTERKHELGRVREREGEREPQAGFVLSATEEQTAQQPPKGQAQVNNGAGRAPVGGRAGVGWGLGPFLAAPREGRVTTETPRGPAGLTAVVLSPERGAKPVTSFVKNLSALSDWYSVYTSAIAFTVNRGSPISLLKARDCLLLTRGWRIQWSIVPEVSEPVEPPKEDLTVSEKFQLVLDVAQKAQNLFGKMADILEKIKNLFMWVQPEITQKLYVALWAAFLASCFFPYRLVGLALGKEAPCPGSGVSVAQGARAASRQSSVKTETLSPKVRFSVKGRCVVTGGRGPLGVALAPWGLWWRQRGRGIPGQLLGCAPVSFSPASYLCFESSKSGSSKRNKVIKLVDITDIQKYKVLSVLPGPGMGLAVSTPSTQKPLVFGAMVHRDEAFETIFSQYMKITAAAASGSDS